jgi:hypothetical protein
MRLPHYARNDVIHELIRASSARDSLTSNIAECPEAAAFHCEKSRKYSLDEFRGPGTQAGYEAGQVWTDPDVRFSVHWLRWRRMDCLQNVPLLVCWPGIR